LDGYSAYRLYWLTPQPASHGAVSAADDEIEMAMTLSERERQLLQEMEAELRIPDPGAAKARRRLHPRRLGNALPRLALGVVGTVAGLLVGVFLLIIGVAVAGAAGTVVSVAATALVIISIDRGVTHLRRRRGHAA
jgi:hypothetical protein